MANTTFSGPVRSENGFEQITKNSTTGAITVEATYDARPNFRQTVDNSTLNTGSAVTTTSSSHVTSGKSATITPKSSSSKIIIQLHLGDTAADNNHAGTGVALYRGSTRVATLNSRHAYSVSGSNPSGLGIAGLSPIWFDSPATTNATTYTVYFDNGGAGTATLFRDGTDGCIVLQEIAG